MNPYPILNSTGWCTDPETAILAIMQDYCTAEVRASKLYTKYVRSLPYQLMKYTDPSSLASVMTDDLTHLYKNVFDNVEASVMYMPDEQGDLPAESPIFRLEISLIVYEDNRRFNLAKIISFKGGEILTIGESVL